jgi:hypothetical protein
MTTLTLSPHWDSRSLAAVAIGIALATPNLPNISTIYVTVT